MTLPQAFELAVQRHQAGRLPDAEALYRQILAAQPNHAGALYLLGVAAQQTGRHILAVDLLRQAIVLIPDNPASHCILGEACHALGRLDEAIAAFRRALELKPDFLEALINLGAALSDRGHIDEAIAAYRRALQTNPGHPEAHNNLGNALRARRQLDDAIAAYRRALESKPGYPEAHNNLGSALRERGQLDEAIAAFRCALEFQSDFPAAHNNLGNALRECGQLDEAVAALRRALEIKPDYPDAHTNLGIALKDQGMLEEAIASYRRALALKPGDASAHSNLLFTLHYAPDHAAGSIADERRRWNRQFGEPLKRSILPHANDRDPARRLRIGYVSPDFWDHVVGRNLVPLFECHDRRDFEIICYSDVLRADHRTDEFRQRAHQWRDTVGAPDEVLAGIIREDGVDILVDLSQHTAGNRLPLFARGPAPVQVSFAGYPDATGLEAIPHRISDRFLNPAATEAGEACLPSLSHDSPDSHGRGEQVHRIDSFWCYGPCGLDVMVNPLPALTRGLVTFGCLNNFYKVNAGALSLWARALQKVPDSRLILLARPGSHRQRTLDALERDGVEARRVEFVDYQPRREYLELYHRLDIALDTFPYNGHTTSLDALWMGIPVVSLVGVTPVSRAGLSQLTNLGLPELAAHSEPEFVAIATRLAGDLPHLAQLRSTLRARMENSILMDAPRFARSIEAAYRSMWRSWCNTRSDEAS